jgi:F-type H+-transporting ATPase subunit epsilon
VTLQVALVVPDRELWAGEARTVIAKTTEGDIGVLTGHSPVFGILAEGSLVEILPPDSSPDQPVLRAAVSGGFLSVAADKVSVLAAQALLSDDVDISAARLALEDAPSGDEESSEAKYARAQLRLAGDQA